jgi:hypothetical protein
MINFLKLLTLFQKGAWAGCFVFSCGGALSFAASYYLALFSSYGFTSK